MLALSPRAFPDCQTPEHNSQSIDLKLLPCPDLHDHPEEEEKVHHDRSKQSGLPPQYHRAQQRVDDWYDLSGGPSIVGLVILLILVEPRRVLAVREACESAEQHDRCCAERECSVRKAEHISRSWRCRSIGKRRCFKTRSAVTKMSDHCRIFYNSQAVGQTDDLCRLEGN